MFQWKHVALNKAQTVVTGKRRLREVPKLSQKDHHFL